MAVSNFATQITWRTVYCVRFIINSYLTMNIISYCSIYFFGHERLYYIRSPVSTGSA